MTNVTPPAFTSGQLKFLGAAALMAGVVIWGQEKPDQETGAAQPQAVYAEATGLPETRPLRAPADAVMVSVAALEEAYDRNEAAAQMSYGKKTLLVSGTIDRITLDMSDKPVVSFASDSLLSADLRFDADHEEQAAGLAKGETRYFVCTEISEVAGSPSLRKCRLAE